MQTEAFNRIVIRNLLGNVSKCSPFTEDYIDILNKQVYKEQVSVSIITQKKGIEANRTVSVMSLNF